MSPRVGNISFPVIKPTEPAKKFYSDKLARLMDEVHYGSLSSTQVFSSILTSNRFILNFCKQSSLNRETQETNYS